MTPFQRVFQKLRFSESSHRARQFSSRPRKIPQIGEMADETCCFIALENTFFRAAKINPNTAIIVDERRITRDIVTIPYEDNWLNQTAQRAIEMTKELWWAAASEESESYQGPYYSKEEALDSIDIGEIVFQGEPKVICPSNSITASYVENFLEELCDDVEDFTSPLEENWHDYWDGKADYKAIADAMREAMYLELRRQGLKTFTMIEPYENSIHVKR